VAGQAGQASRVLWNNVEREACDHDAVSSLF